MAFESIRCRAFAPLFGLILAAPAIVALRAEDSDQLTVVHAECSFFGKQRNQFAEQARRRYALSAMTEEVSRRLGTSTGTSGMTHVAAAAGDPAASGNLIDQYIFAALKNAGVAPADKADDYSFLRRVTLDLSGRIPSASAVQPFVNDASADKRSKLVDTLLASPEWIDRWTMYFGDRLKNTDFNPSSGVRRFPDGRNAFYTWIKTSLTNNKPYDQMARELIAAKGDNSYTAEQAAINWMVGGIVAGGPQQDIWDQQTANVAETFLGLAHVNCLLCHNGRGHLDSLSLWGSSTSRYQAWQLASYMSQSREARVNPDASNRNVYYWNITDNLKAANYPLNTTTGNRPARQPTGSDRNVAPVYFFNGDTPKSGENYRDGLARSVTSDLQFARASVNYVWSEFFGRGIVEPANQFDPARLDPNNPPPDPWMLQPSNAALLNALAKDFIDSGYDLKHLMRLIVTSDAYQLSSTYGANWNPAWEPLFARKLVRRLWGEEITDSIALSSNVPTKYNVAGFGTIAWAMQAPEPKTIQTAFLASFLPGNRDDQPRREDGAVQQALSLMNDTTVMARTRMAGSGAAASLLTQALNGNDDQLIDMLFMSVLSRHATDAERNAAVNTLRAGNRADMASDLLWSLYNKVDFIFNY
jgi:Protein of unknown function (DUF1549)/Protein of unknown function (DUF1553)